MAGVTAADTKKMDGKVVIITGSSSGIGESMAYEFCRQGASITIHGRDRKKLQAVQDECEKLTSGTQKVLPVVGDITKEELREQLIDVTVKFFGKIDVLINNAGYANVLPIEKNEGLKPLDDMLDIHVRAPYHLTKLCIPELIKNKGVLINVSSIAGQGTSHVDCTEYSMAKCALEQFTKWVAYELGPKGVRALNINPGVIRTPFGVNSGIRTAAEAEAAFKNASKMHALNRAGEPEEVAKVAVFMCSDDASFVSGVTLMVDGGNRILPCGPSRKNN